MVAVGQPPFDRVVAPGDQMSDSTVVKCSRTTSGAEFDRRDGVDAADLVAAATRVAALRSTVTGVNLVVGFRPELWAAHALSAAPSGVTGFAEPVVGPDGFTMPATQHDLLLWLGGAHDLVFDAVMEATAGPAGVAVVAEETIGAQLATQSTSTVRPWPPRPRSCSTSTAR